jgi:hypothetical protein
MRPVALAWMCVAVIGLSQTALARPNAPAPPAFGEAPIGHRQPTASSLGGVEKGGEKFDTLSKMQKEDQELDRKLQGICRGC